jgi:hypothetical protein
VEDGLDFGGPDFRGERGRRHGAQQRVELRHHALLEALHLPLEILHARVEALNFLVQPFDRGIRRAVEEQRVLAVVRALVLAVVRAMVRAVVRAVLLRRAVRTAVHWRALAHRTRRASRSVDRSTSCRRHSPHALNTRSAVTFVSGFGRAGASTAAGRPAASRAAPRLAKILEERLHVHLVEPDQAWRGRPKRGVRRG